MRQQEAVSCSFIRNIACFSLTMYRENLSRESVPLQPSSLPFVFYWRARISDPEISGGRGILRGDFTLPFPLHRCRFLLPETVWVLPLPFWLLQNIPEEFKM